MATNPILNYLPELLYQFADEEPIGYSIFPNMDTLQPAIHHFFVDNGAGGIDPRFNLDPDNELLAYSTMEKTQVSLLPFFRFQ